MSRLFVVAAGLMLLVPAFGLAQSGSGKPTSQVIPVSQYGEAKPAKCATCPGAKGPIIPAKAEVYGPVVPYGTRLQAQLWDEDHECSPDGCPKPVGCGNFWTEKKFIFGSCRQFFGTAGSTYGFHRAAVER